MFLGLNFYIHKNIFRCDNGLYYILEMNNLHNVFDTIEDIYFQ